ncbi:MAG: GNAT family N-acetyltransferase [Nitrososphaerales archaeon]|nr:GNAT family N-acetyltransferase [Nitrososphaerales archaeon]
MGLLRRRDLELNELRWWSNWAKLSWLDKNTHMLSSRDFAEPFFNRAGFLSCAGISSSLEGVERRFRSLGLDPVLLVHDKCTVGRKALTRKGYRMVDTMTVLASTSDLPRADPAPTIAVSSSCSIDDWSRAYLQSFYGDERLLLAVTKVARRLKKLREATLLQTRLEGSVAGVLAIFRTPGLAGVYCVGTLPKFRRRGVAGTLIGRAKEIAIAEGRRLCLQTLESDGAEPFYLARGFTKLYRKNFLAKEN